MDGDCYEPSTLISWVHEEVPFVAVGFNNSGRGAEELVDSLDEGLGSYYDYFVRAVIWGAVVTVVCIPLLVLTCMWYCCTARLCRGNKLIKRDSVSYKVARTLCGALLILQILVSACIIGVCVWAEEQFSKEFRDNIDGVKTFISNVSSITTSDSSGSSNGDTLHLLTQFEDTRHRIFIGYFSFLFLPLIGVLLAIVSTTLCKHPVTMIIILVILTIVSVFTSLIIGLAAAFLIIYSDVCVGLQYKQLNDVTEECMVELTDYSNTLDNFCNNAYLHGMIVLAASATLVITYIGKQLSGSCYAGLHTGYRGGTRIQPLDNEEDSHELQSRISLQPNPPEEGTETSAADTTVLLSAMEMEAQSPGMEEVQQYLCDQPSNPKPSAPRETSPSSTLVPPPPTPVPSSSSPPLYPPLSDELADPVAEQDYTSLCNTAMTNAKSFYGCFFLFSLNTVKILGAAAAAAVWRRHSNCLEHRN